TVAYSFLADSYHGCIDPPDPAGPAPGQPGIALPAHWQVRAAASVADDCRPLSSGLARPLRDRGAGRFGADIESRRHGDVSARRRTLDTRYRVACQTRDLTDLLARRFAEARACRQRRTGHRPAVRSFRICKRASGVAAACAARSLARIAGGW